MKRLVQISILFFSLLIWQANGENLTGEATRQAAQYYSVMAREGMSPYKDGRVVYFENGSAYTALLDKNLKKTDIQPAPELDELGIEGHFAYDPSGKLYYTRGGELYSTTWKNDKWEKPQQEEIVRIKAERQTLPGSMIAYSGWRYKPKDVKLTGVSNPALSEDGKRLYYAADIEGTYGGTDIWYSDLDEDGNWTPPVNMGRTVNTSTDENIPLAMNSGFFYTSAPGAKEENMYMLPSGLKGAPQSLATILTPVEAPVAEVAETKERPAPIPVPVLADMNESNSNVYTKDPNTCVFLFDFDNDNLTGSQEKEMNLILEFINHHKDGEFMITGYTDERGSQAYNQKLSERRAKKIYQLLLERGVPANRLKYKGMGKLNPIIKNAQTEEEHQKNRRVEIQNVK